jgi:hypothetical protein
MTITKNIKPEDVCPDDQIDPSLPGYKPMHVEQTLTIMRGIRPIKKKRLWLYYRATPEDLGLTDIEMEAKIREKFSLIRSEASPWLPPRVLCQPNAKIEHCRDEWAIWSGPGEPTEPAFEPDEERVVDGKVERVSSWYYSSIHLTEDTIRKAFQAPEDAPVFKHPIHDLLAVWIGSGPPTRPAFPPLVGITAAKKQEQGRTDLRTRIKRGALRALDFAKRKLEDL